MSSDGYFDDDIDDETLEQLDAIEAQYQQSTEQRPVSARAPSPINIDSSDYGESIDLDESALDALKAIEDGTFQQLPRKVAPSLARSSSKGTLQTTLFGEVIPAGASTTRSKPHAQRTRSKQEPRKTKQWDHTAFAKTGVKTGNARGKGKKKQQDEDEEGEEEEEFEFEQFPPPFPPPRKIQLDLLEAKHWIFPLNRPKRDYQFDIVRNSLFENTIVALPTGTGKTFIAGVVMLNYYRWFPEGKVVFVAPTRPLVSQQIEACHEACGIPGSDAIEMTGQVSKPIRHKFWGQKRVFYMTPQTLINDLQSENCDARDIVLLVVDEAHRATGDYAYNQVIRYMMAKNPHFRVLALTATPGGNKEAVQTLIDGLHISHIEIRAERELARYNHVKEIEQHVISMTPEINRIKDLFLKLMDSFFKPIAHIWRGSPNLMRMHPFAATSLAASLAQGQRHLCGPLYTLSSFARWLGYLMEGTVKMCYDDLEAYAPKATKAKKVHTNPLFLNLMNEIRAQNAQGFKMHPKMEKMKNLIMQHFGARMSEDGDPESGEGATKAMVFVTHRAAVDEIVEVLNAEQPLIRATPFIGQGTDKKGKKGLAQREQLETIKKFKNNEFNILVATSIGEEGLDIGEVDLAICYDTQKTPIRLLQRLGRTGRKRSGHVHVLLADGREEANFDKAQSSYEDVQASIIYGSHLEFYADVERLLPDNVQPQCLEKEMEIIPYVRDEAPKKRDNSPRKGVKRKRNDDIGRNMPQGASTGFVSVADLLVKEKGGKKARKIREPKNFEALGEDDEDDLELASGIFGEPPALKKSKSASAPKPKAGTSMLRKSKTLDPSKPKKTKKTKKGKAKEKEKEEAPPPSEWTASQLQAKGVDDSDDLEIENGVLSTKTNTLSPRRSSSGQAVVNEEAKVIDLTDSDREASGKPLFQYPQRYGSTDFPLKDFEQAFQSPTGSWSQSPPRVSPSRNVQNMAWLLEDEDEDGQLDFDIVNSSPVVERTQQPLEPDNSVLDLNDSDSSPGRSPSQCRMSVDDSLEFMDDASSPTRSAYTRVSSPVDSSSIYIHASPQAPEPSFAIRPMGKKRITTLAFTNSSPSIESPAQTHRRLHRRHESSGSEMPPPTIPGIKRSQDKHKRRKRPRVPMKHNPLYDYEATHSGDEESEGSSGSEDVESESDRMFLEELPETQASPSYDQSLAYRQSLLTQAPDGGPSFASKPVRRGRFGRNSIRTQNSNRRRPGVSSSPTREDETDLYEFGSFVVSDDAEISYEM
ncbi:P-loop containing nucleoside triphosphate hydrolase protein [Lentinula novae-zelandiae]|nr:P-loop containing nucleoside triphosphate hydrolase protein [Lentinula novae-zelandiae]